MVQTAIAASSNLVRQPIAQVQIAWDGTTFIDETAYVTAIDGEAAVTGRRAGNTAVGASVSDKCKIVLDNTSGRFSRAKNPGAPVPNSGTHLGGYYCPVTVNLGFAGYATLRQFTGVVVAPSEAGRQRTLTLDCADRWTMFKGKKLSTQLYRSKRPDELIGFWNTAAGLGAGGAGYPTSLERSERIIGWAWLEDDSAADDCQRIAEADGGVVLFDKVGTLRYFGATWPARNTTSVYTFTVSSFEDLAPALDFSQVYDKVNVRARPRYVGLQDVLWSSPADLAVEANATLDIKAVFQSPAYALVKPGYVASQNQDWLVKTDWVAVSGAGQILEVGGASQVSVTFLNAAGAAVFNADGTILNQFEAQSGTIRLVNSNGSHRAYLRKLQIRGNPVVAGKSTEESDSYGIINQVLSVDNIYIQTREHGQAVAKSRRYRASTPAETLVVKGVPAQPHLEVFDRVTVQETTRTGISADYFITRFTYRFGGGGDYVQDFELTKAGGETPHGNYFRIGAGASALDGAAVSWF